jgi:hypothetical protein
MAQIRYALISTKGNTITICKRKYALNKAWRYISALAVVDDNADRYPLALASRHVLFERFLFAGLPAAPRCPKESQYFIRDSHCRLRLPGRSNRPAVPHELLAVLWVCAGGPFAGELRGIVRVTPSAARAF